MVHNYPKWITDEVLTMGMTVGDDKLSNIKTSNVFRKDIKMPRSISALSREISSFDVNTGKESFTFHLDFNKHKEVFDSNVTDMWIRKGFTPIAKSNKGKHIYYEGESFYLDNDGNMIPLGELEDMLGLDGSGSPAEFAELKIAGKYVPIGIILAHEYGLTELIKRLKINVRRVPVGTRVQQQPDEVALTFNDETLVFSKNDKLATMLLGGFQDFKKIIRGFSITDFDNKGVYQNLLDVTGGGTRVIREIELAKQLFVDPITKEILIQLKQPTEFNGILVYATELLLNDMHKDEFDMSEMRIKGYERIVGIVYQEMVKAIRAHNSRPGKSRYPVDMKPFAVWETISKDSSIVTHKDINPIEDLKQREEVTFTGHGGRGKDTMTGATREYGKNDLGIISEASKDSGEVGVNTYMPPNPQIANTLGMPMDLDKKDISMSSIFSPSVLANPASTKDDMKRMGFISIQNAHSMAVNDMRENILQTDYCNIIPHRVTETFAVTAKQDGVVKEISADGITVQYKDGTSKQYPLGRIYGENAGMTIPHQLITPLKVGNKFTAGDTITYNEGYFKPSTLNPRQVTWCNGTFGVFALCENSDTLEDASAISQEFSRKLTTKQSKIKTIVVDFKQSVLRLVKVGTKVSYDDPLCIIQDEITSNMSIYDEADIDILKALGSHAPRAKCDGIVEKIEVYYRGDKEDMSDNIRKLVSVSDKEIAQRRKASGKTVVTGEIDESFRVDGNPIPLDSIAIRIFITGDVPASVGDKLVLVSQLKTVIGKVLKEPMRAKDGTRIDGRFGYKSIAARIVNSPEIVGTTMAVLIKGSQLAVAAYDS